MSSAYSALCLSHDPALVIGNDTNYSRASSEGVTSNPADHADLLDGHAGCDLLVGRYSYPLVEVGCPGSIGNPTNCCPGVHKGMIWADVAWLRLLHQRLAEGQDDELTRALTRSCWSRERLDRLSVELRAGGGS